MVKNCDFGNPNLVDVLKEGGALLLWGPVIKIMG